MFMTVFFIILLLYVIGNMVFYISSRFHYAVYSTLIRKGLYSLFIIGMLIGVMLGEVDGHDWKIILVLAAAVVFIDLSVFLTPNILKIWSAEFQYANEIEENIKMSKDRIEFMNRKSSVFSTIVQEDENDLTSIGSIVSQAVYEEKLLGFVKRYTQEFEFSIRLYFLPGHAERDNATEDKISETLQKMENTFNITIDDKQNVETSLLDAQAYVSSDERHAIIPIYEDDADLLIVLSANEGNIIEIDLFNVINLVTLFNWRVGIEKLVLQYR